MAFSKGLHRGAAYQTGFFMKDIFVHDRAARRGYFFYGSDMPNNRRINEYINNGNGHKQVYSLMNSTTWGTHI